MTSGPVVGGLKKSRAIFLALLDIIYYTRLTIFFKLLATKPGEAE